MDRDWADKRTDDLADRVGRFEETVDRRFDKVDQRFDKVDRQFEQAEAATRERFSTADVLEKERFTAVHAEIAVASKKTDKVIWTLIGLSVSIVASGVGKILFG